MTISPPAGNLFPGPALADRFGRRVNVIGRTASARNLEVKGAPVSLPTTGLLEDYEQLVGPARRRFAESSAVLAPANEIRDAVSARGALPRTDDIGSSPRDDFEATVA
jgi:hypothetical protein